MSVDPVFTVPYAEPHSEEHNRKRAKAGTLSTGKSINRGESLVGSLLNGERDLNCLSYSSCSPMMSLSHHSSNESSPDKKPAAVDKLAQVSTAGCSPGMLLSDERKATNADNGSDHDQEDDEEGASSPSTLPPAAAAAAKGRAAAASASSTTPRKKKATRVKKPKDMPRRPLSAYNLFFREERERMINEHRQTAQAARGDTNEPLPEPKIGFENMAKTIGKRWKALSEEEMARYKDLAKEDMKRYRRERDAYQ